ncbi:MAG: hypothetical protein NT136_02735 [Candidatus Moranbacteria bacterium]|nr:hypothetical protein [Candidatus Moranbacteria bacterium]
MVRVRTAEEARKEAESIVYSYINERPDKHMLTSLSDIEEMINAAEKNLLAQPLHC